jgi:diphthine synthase
MLFFIGLGLYDERDISVKGLDIVKRADLVYAEFYTSRLMGASIERLEEFYGRDVIPLSREDVEVDPAWLYKARSNDVAFLVGGDPMISTTHLDLRLRALDMGIETRIIHASTILPAVSGLTGLQNYRFGRSTSIPFPYIARERRVVPETPYKVAMENRRLNLHTLLYLDLQGDRCMTVNDGIEILLEVDREEGDGRLGSMLGVGIARAGSEDALVKADSLENLLHHQFGGPLHILVIPAGLHFMEGRALMTLAGAPEDLVRAAEL